MFMCLVGLVFFTVSLILYRMFTVMRYLRKFNEKLVFCEKEKIIEKLVMFNIYKFVIESLEQSNDVRKILNDLLQKISELFEADAWSFLLTPEHKNWTFLAWSYKMDKKPLDEMASFLQDELPETVKKILQTKQMFYVVDTTNYNDWKEIKETQNLSWIGIPIVIDNKVYGILNLDFYNKFKKLSKSEKKMISLLMKDLPIIINHIFNLKNLVLDSYKDILTGVYNRKILYDKKLADYKFFFFIDINQFKQINDTYGHLIGDEILKIIAKRLENVFKEEDLIIRYGGDEFLVCLKDNNSVSIDNVKERIKNIINKEIIFKDQKIKISASIGTFVKNENEPLNVIIEKADELMYKDKMKNRKKN